MIKIKLAILIIFVSGTICSCLTDSKLKKHADMYYGIHPDLLARRCANDFPATVTKGDTTRSSDTTYLPGAVIPCPDREDINGKVIRDSVKCPPPKIIHDKVFVHDTIIDNAAVKAMEGDTARVGAENRTTIAKMIQTSDDLRKYRDKAKTRLFILIGVAAFALFALVYAIKKATTW